MLKSNGPNIDLCSTPKNMPCILLYLLSISTLCFLSLRKLQTNLNAFLSDAQACNLAIDIS